MKKLAAGADFGSDSVRVVLASVDGATVSEAVRAYPRWEQKKYCDFGKKQFRQHPLDYIEAFEGAMKEALEKAGQNAGRALAGIAFDTTGSTPCPVNREGTPLALLDEFRENPNAMFHLWKDHTAVEEARELNLAFSGGAVDYTRYQGIYSSEWYWAKILHTSRGDPKVREAAWAWVEHSDWMPALLTGNTVPETMYRCACGAGHKALWHSAFGGLPPLALLGSVDPCLVPIAAHYGAPRPSDCAAGVISAEWAARLGVNEDVIIGGSSFDAHAGAVGAGVAEGTMVKVVGTSTVDMLVARPQVLAGKDLRACCGQAENSILPGLVGIEASQAAFGDVYAWFRELMLWPLRSLPGLGEEREAILKKVSGKVLPALEQAALSLPDSGETALDWFNGRRYPNLNESVCAALSGLTLGSGAPQVFRALVMGTVFGSRRIFQSFLENGIPVERLIAVGGIARKSAYVMQMMADVLERPIMVCREEQVCARGAAIYAAVCAGLYQDIPSAQKAFCEPYQASYFPDPAKAETYRALYEKYLSLGEYAEKA